MDIHTHTHTYSLVETGRCFHAQPDCLPQGKEPPALTERGMMSLIYDKLMRE